MAEGDLGVAQLRVTADISQARASLETLRLIVSRGFGDIGPSLFGGLERQASVIGAKVGTELSRSLTGALKSVDLSALRTQLDFAPQIKSSTGALRDFQAALGSAAVSSQSLNTGLRETTAQTSQLSAGLRLITGATTNTEALSASFVGVRNNIQGSLAALRLLSPELQRLTIAPQLGGRFTPSSFPSPIASPTLTGAIPTGKSQSSKNALNEINNLAISLFEGRNPPIDRQAQAIELLQTRLERLRNTPIALDASSIRKLGEEASKASEGILDFTRKIVNGTKNTASSIAGLRQQYIDFAELAANTKLGSSPFTTFTQAAAKAQQRETLSGGLAQIEALRRLYKLPQQGILDSFKGTERLLNFNPGETAAGIKLYISALEQARSVTEISDRNFSRLTDEINKQRQALDAATQSTLEYTRSRQLLAEAGVSRREAKLQGIQEYYASANPRAGGVRDANGVMLARGSGDTAAEAAYRQTVDQAEKERRITAEIQRQNEQHRLAYEAIRAQRLERQQQLAIERERVDQRERAAAEYRASPVTGLRPDGTTIPGSPAGNARIDAFMRERSQSYSNQQDLRLQQERRVADFRAGIGLSASPVSGLRPDGTTIPASPAGNARIDALLRQRQESEIQRQLAIAARGAVPIDGRLPNGRFAPGSPAARKDFRERLGRAGGDALIGGAFPLLFGQGLGASIGGGLGGGIGGAVGGQFGFGLSLVGTAVGGAVDTLQKRFTDLSAALQDPIKNIGTLTQQFILASKSQEDYITALIETGQTARAAQLVREQSFRTIDPATAASVASVTDSYNRNLALTQNLLGAIVSGPAAGFVGFLNGILRAISGVNPTNTQRTAGPEGQAAFQQRRQEQAGNLLFNVFNPLSALVAPQRTTNLQRQRRIAFSNEVDRAENQSASADKEQLRIQNAINDARLQGNTPLVEALNTSDKLTAARTAYSRRETEIAQSLAAGDIKLGESLQAQSDNRQTLFIEQSKLTESARNAQRISAQQLSDDQRRVEAQRQIANLTGARSFSGQTGLVRANASAQILEQRLQLEAAQREQAAKQQAFNIASRNPADKAALGIAQNELLAANSALESARITTAARVRQIEVATQAELLQLQRQRFAEQVASASRIKSIQDQQVIEGQRRNFGPNGLAVFGALQQYRNVARDSNDARRIAARNPNDEGLQRAAQEASERLKLAGIQFRNNLQDAFEAAKRGAEDLRSRFAAARTALLEQIGGATRPGTVNAVLEQRFGLGAARDRQRDAFPRIVEDFKAAQEALARQEEKLGRIRTADLIRQVSFPGIIGGGLMEYRDPQTGRNVSKPTYSADFVSPDVTQQIVDATNAFRNEIDTRKNVDNIQKDLVKANNDLTVATVALRDNGIPSVVTAVEVLSQNIVSLDKKDWNIYITVPGTSTPTPLPRS